jgi:hypothetical protein
MARTGCCLHPNIDRLFDQGFISFTDQGDLLIAPVADTDCLRRLGVPIDEQTNVGPFTEKQRRYLAFHRQNLFLMAGVDG